MNVIFFIKLNLAAREERLNLFSKSILRPSINIRFQIIDSPIGNMSCIHHENSLIGYEYSQYSINDLDTLIPHFQEADWIGFIDLDQLMGPISYPHLLGESISNKNDWEEFFKQILCNKSIDIWRLSLHDSFINHFILIRSSFLQMNSQYSFDQILNDDHRISSEIQRISGEYISSLYDGKHASIPLQGDFFFEQKMPFIPLNIWKNSVFQKVLPRRLYQYLEQFYPALSQYLLTYLLAKEDLYDVSSLTSYTLTISDQRLEAEIDHHDCVFVLYLYHSSYQIYCNYLASVPPDMDILVIRNDFASFSLQELQNYVTSLYLPNRVQIIRHHVDLPEFIPALYMTARHIIQDYNIVCFYSDQQETDRYDFVKYEEIAAQNFIGTNKNNSYYMSNVIHHLKKDPSLGILFPPCPDGIQDTDKWMKSIDFFGVDNINLWNELEDYLTFLGVDHTKMSHFSQTKKVGCSHHCFYVKVSAISQMIQYNYKYGDFRRHPLIDLMEMAPSYVAQSNGFYTRILINASIPNLPLIEECIYNLAKPMVGVMPVTLKNYLIKKIKRCESRFEKYFPKIYRSMKKIYRKYLKKKK